MVHRMIDDIPARECWAALQAQPAAALCDVRTEQEWRTVGVPDLAPIGKRTVFASWALAPAMQPNARFVEELAAAGLRHDDPVYFICRSGARSAAAAQAAQAAGYRHVFNVAEGFEGRPGAYPGWAAQGLPARELEG
jgi:rhodanese-related sulfurtransferase